MYYVDVDGSDWTVHGEVKQDGLLVARFVYAKYPDHTAVQCGGWGDRGNIAILNRALVRITQVLNSAAVHTYEDRNADTSMFYSALSETPFAKNDE